MVGSLKPLGMMHKLEEEAPAEAYYVHSGSLNVNGVVSSVEPPDTFVAMGHLHEHAQVGVDKIDLYLATHQGEFEEVQQDYADMGESLTGLAGIEVEEQVDQEGAVDMEMIWVLEDPALAEDYDSLEHTSYNLSYLNQ